MKWLGRAVSLSVHQVMIKRPNAPSLHRCLAWANPPLYCIAEQWERVPHSFTLLMKVCAQLPAMWSGTQWRREGEGRRERTSVIKAPERFMIACVFEELRACECVWACSQFVVRQWSAGSFFVPRWWSAVKFGPDVYLALNKYIWNLNSGLLAHKSL